MLCIFTPAFAGTLGGEPPDMSGQTFTITTAGAHTVTGAIGPTPGDTQDSFSVVIGSGQVLTSISYSGQTTDGYGDPLGFSLFGCGLWGSGGLSDFNHTFSPAQEGCTLQYSITTGFQGTGGNWTVTVNTIDKPNNAPTDVTLSNYSVSQTAGVNAVVGTFSTTDPDSGETFTYSLVSGTGSTNNSLFNISGDSLWANNTTTMSAGNYSIRVRTTDHGGLFYEKQMTIAVTVYPVISANNTDSADIINQVVFGFINKTSGSDSGGYGDYSALSTSINRGASANLTVYVGSTYVDASYQGYWSIKVFFDWNHNLNFEDTGEGFEVKYNITRAEIANPGFSPFTKSITIPADAALGSTRMRVVYRWQQNLDEPVPSTGNFGWGEAEDYTINITDPNTVPTFVGSTTTLTVNQNSGATDIKGLLHVSDTDSSQTETWTQSVAPNHGGTLSFTSATASSGSADIAPGGTITYQPAAGYSGTETFTVQVSDGTATATRMITVTVNPLYTVTYNGNGNTGGSAPTDGSSPYLGGSTVTVLGNTGSLVRTGFTFAGWNTAANGSGTSYAPAATFAIAGNTTLYAKWTGTVTYNGNGSTSGSVPTDATAYLPGATVTAAANSGSLVKTGYSFSGWNTLADGTGITYTAGSGTFAMAGDITLYARWTASVTYNGNSNTGGSVPTDATAYLGGATVTVLGNTGVLTRNGFTFAGWNTAADGSGTSYAAADTFSISGNTTLYARWTASVTYNGNSSTGGSVPTDATAYLPGATVTVPGNTGALVRTGYTFVGWNTAANGSGTNYAPAATFTITGDTTLYAQWLGIPVATAASSISFTGFAANWNSVTGATGYYLDVATDSGFGVGTFVAGHDSLDVGNVTTKSVTGLSSGTPYYYRVRAYNASGTSDNSNTISVTTGTTRVVTNNSDNDPGSLRQTIIAANPGDEITFASNVTGSITLLTGELLIDKDLTISGPGADILTISGNNAVRVFTVNSGVVFTMQGVTVANGKSSSGGGLYNSGTVTITNSTFLANSIDVGYSVGGGGGIFNRGTLTVTNSTFSDNEVAVGFGGAGSGGAIFNQGTVTVTNSTFSGNFAFGGGSEKGGAIDNAGTLTVTNSTFSGNEVIEAGTAGAARGGGIHNSWMLSMTNCTFSGNAAVRLDGGEGGGIYNRGTLNYANTIIAKSPGGGDCYNAATIASSFNNLVQDGSCSSSLNGDPLLGPLADNGGPTQTMALLPGSSAIDAGNDSVCAASPVNNLDQRGIARPQGSHCDIGAFESQGFTMTISNGDNQYAIVNTSFASDLVVTVTANNAGEPADGGLVTFSSPGSGASASITGSPATIIGGVASVSATANSTVGSYTVTASAGGTGSAGFNLTNVSMPDTTIDTEPSNPSGSASASFTFSGSQGVGLLSFECDLDSGGFSACTSPKSYSSLGEGSHTFQVRSVDSVNNKDATPASYTWVIDTIPPDTSMTANPLNPANSTSASFSFTGNDGSGTGVAGFECSLDSGGFSACTSPKSYSSLGDGSHTFQVRAVDAAGNADATPASYTWVIDAIPPDTNITSNPSNPTNSTSASFSFSGNDGSGTGVASFECKLDSGSFGVCTSPASYSGLSSAGHTFQVRAVDAAGNADATPASYPWTIDTVLPIVDTFTVTSPTVSLDIAITAFTASDAGGVNGYMITQSSTPPAANDAGWSGTPPGTYTVGGGGSYTLYPWARDTAGNVSTVFGSPRVVSVCYPSITVGNNADSGDGSLRKAISDICPGGTINFNGDYTISLASTLAISKNVTIDGDGHSVTVSGNSQCTVFMVSQSIAFNLNNVTVADGHGPSSGGIYNYRGTVTVTNSTFSSNTATAATPGGGAIRNYGGTLTVTNSTFSSNTTYDSFCSGGAICNDLPAAVLTVTGSTFSANTAPYGGGIRNNGGTVTVTDSSFLDNNATTYGGGLSNNIGTVTVTGSTFSGNSASYAGGGISNGDALTVTNSTFSGNSVSGAGGGGGIYLGSSDAVVSVTNSTFSGNSATGTLGGGIHILLGTATILNTVLWGNTGGEIIGVATVSDSVVQGGATGSNIIVADPLLGHLGDYGSSTQTIPLLPGSAAIRGTNTNCPATDQRGVTRGASCDIGAFESRGFTFGTPAGTPQSTPFSTPFATPLGVTVISAYGEPVNGGLITFTAPSSGASITASSSQVPISGGAVSLDVTANGTIGTYQVTASASGIVLPAIFDLSNGLATQSTLFLAAPSDLTTATSATLSTTGGSGSGAVTYQVTAGTCHVSGDQLTADASTGTCTVTATKAADATYSEAVSAPAIVTLHPFNKITGTVVSGPGSGTNECAPSDVAYGGSFTCTLTPSKGYDLYGLYDNSVNWTGSVGIIGNHYSYAASNVTSDHTVKANFANYPVIVLNGVNSDCEVSLTSAVTAATRNGDRIQAQALTFTEALNFAHPGIALSLEGGYDSGFSSPIGHSVIRGSVTISNGAVTVENITIR